MKSEVRKSYMALIINNYSVCKSKQWLERFWWQNHNGKNLLPIWHTLNCWLSNKSFWTALKKDPKLSYWCSIQFLTWVDLMLAALCLPMDCPCSFLWLLNSPNLNLKQKDWKYWVLHIAIEYLFIIWQDSQLACLPISPHARLSTGSSACHELLVFISMS